MPARRRLPGSESDDIFTVVVDDQSYIDDEQAKKYGSHKPQTGPATWSFKQIIGGATDLGTRYTTNLVQAVTQQAAPPLPAPVSAVQPDDLDYFDEPEEEPIVVMVSRDRTNEFATAIRSLQSRNIARAVNISDPRKAKQLQSYGEFMMIAKTVGRNIASTYSKLEKLTLCKLNEVKSFYKVSN